MEHSFARPASGGGDLALQSYINRTFEDPLDDKSISPRPDALVLYCPAFDGIDIWFVKTQTLIQRTKADAAAFLPLLTRFVKNTTDAFATPLQHRVDLIELAATLGAERGIAKDEIEQFQKVLQLFTQRDWQLLHPFQDALEMSASRILPPYPLPPTLIMFARQKHQESTADDRGLSDRTHAARRKVISVVALRAFRIARYNDRLTTARHPGMRYDL